MRPARFGGLPSGAAGRTDYYALVYHTCDVLSGDRVEEGKTRFWCRACMKSFISDEGEVPEACPEGHRAGATDPVAAQA